MLRTPRCFSVVMSSQENSIGTIYGEDHTRTLWCTETRIASCFRCKQLEIILRISRMMSEFFCHFVFERQEHPKKFFFFFFQWSFPIYAISQVNTYLESGFASHFHLTKIRITDYTQTSKSKHQFKIPWISIRVSVSFRWDTQTFISTSTSWASVSLLKKSIWRTFSLICHNHQRIKTWDWWV